MRKCGVKKIERAMMTIAIVCFKIIKLHWKRYGSLDNRKRYYIINSNRYFYFNFHGNFSEKSCKVIKDIMIGYYKRVKMNE